MGIWTVIKIKIALMSYFFSFILGNACNILF
nr:MAG TPA: hypothetical protein [Caudoviricetes sp.]